MTKCLLCEKRYHSVITLRQFLMFKEEQGVLCPTCQAGFEYLESPVCPGCGREKTKKLCLDCEKWKKKEGEILRNRALFAYNATFKTWLHAVKMQGDIRLAGCLSHPLKQLYHDFSSYIWIPLPSSNENLRKRGFHQTILFLKEAKIPYQMVFEVEDSGEKQAYRNRYERLHHEREIWIHHLEKLTKPVILFDDVYTTGATMHQMASALKRAGVYSIQGITLAR
ncbi:ComF family protein [Aerococcus christensenii]|uniref:ComF family protein n=1 Tax=Aerococcus christensenii TaxID=87541 RepID=UPI003F43FDA1